MATDYQKKIEQKGITEYRGYIDEQMSQAREALDAEKRSQHLANAVAANGMLLRGLAVGFVTGELNYKAIQEISRGLQNTQAFQSLMKAVMKASTKATKKDFRLQVSQEL